MGSHGKTCSPEVSQSAYINVTYATQNVVGVRFRFYNSHNSQTKWARVHEVNLLNLLTVENNYKIDLEYQWTAAEFSKLNEEVCIYLLFHSGNENLEVNYRAGSNWVNLGTIYNTPGWYNFTATGLTSQLYTIQLKGTTESGDASQDIWQIDTITLHTWDP